MKSFLSHVSFFLVLAAFGWANAADFTESFNEGISIGDVWALAQTQRGHVEKAVDPVDDGNIVALMRAGGKRGGRVGKAALVHRFTPVGMGRTVIMRGSFFFPDNAAVDSVILMDLECASCGLDTNPGVRLYLRDGRLRIDRSKIGLRQALLPHDPRQVSPRRWHVIEWRSTLGHGDGGRSVVLVDGDVVLDARGDTLLSQEIVREFADIDVEEAVDRFQVGLTANSNRGESTLLLDNVSFSID